MASNHRKHNFHLKLFYFFIILSVKLFAQDTVKVNPIWLGGIYEQPIMHWYYAPNDDSAYNKKDYDFSHWQYTNVKDERNLEQNIQWFSARVKLYGAQKEDDVFSIVLTDIVSAYEVYWNGELVGQSGQVGDSIDDEIPGVVYTVFKLDKESTQPGFYNLSIRISNYHTNIGNPFGFISLSNYSVVHFHRASKTSFLLFNAGTLLTAGLFCIAMFFSGRRNRYYLWLALYCFWDLFRGLYSTYVLYSDVTSSALSYINILYEYGRLISVLAFLLFVVHTYDIPKKILVISFSFILFLLVIFFNKNGIFLPIINNRDILVILIWLLIIYAVKQKTVGAIPALIGIIGWKFFEYSYVFPFITDNYMLYGVLGQIILLFCVIISITLKINKQENMLYQIKLRSSRLEVELLKKNIQPHFILNTLQSIINWIKKKPENAVVLINSLAEEFKMINQIFDQKFITLEKEVELCETHLKIMSLRLGAEYKLESNGLCCDELVPPMIFHTLIENALTHSFKTQEDGVINLKCEKDGYCTKYIVSNNGSRLQEIHEKDPKEIQEGMGIKYIKARLEESYPSKWEIDYKLNNNLWEVTIIICSN